MTSQRNVGEHFGGQGGAESVVTGLGPTLVVKGMGPRTPGIPEQRNRGIHRSVNNVGEAIESYLAGRLSGLTEPCRDARHKFPSC